jgi:transcriptional regulator with XRE-family HTH domain
MGASVISDRWAPSLIKQLRGWRTQAEFGVLLGVPRNTVWRWESNASRPHPRTKGRIAKLAEQEGFMKKFKLVGSVTILVDLEEGSKQIAASFKALQKKKPARPRR